MKAMEYHVENVGMGRSFDESFYFLKDAKVHARRLSHDHTHLIFGVWSVDEEEPRELIALYHRGQCYMQETEAGNE